jgi:hypothetical protein
MLGAPRIEAYIAKLKLSFFRRLCLLPDCFIVKQLFVVRLAQHMFDTSVTRKGFLADIMEIRERFGLCDIISPGVLTGTISDKITWEDTILNNIVDLEYNHYLQRTQNDPDFAYFNQIQSHCFSHSILWDAAKEIPGSLPKFSYVAKLIVWLDSVEFNSSKVCSFCGRNFYNPIIHMLTSCKSTYTARNQLMNFISNHCSVHLEAYLVSLGEHDFACAMLGSPIPEDILHSVDIHYILLYRFAVYINSVSDCIYDLLLQSVDPP